MSSGTKEYIINPKTGRWVLKYGKIGREILKAQAVPAPVPVPVPSPAPVLAPVIVPIKKPCPPCTTNKICNYNTGRCVLKTGNIGKKILKAQVVPAPVPVTAPVPVPAPALVKAPTNKQLGKLTFYPNIFRAEYLDYAVNNLNEVKKFVNSDSLEKVIYSIKQLSIKPDFNINIINKRIIKSGEALCISPRFFFAYSKGEEKNFNKKYKFSDTAFILLTDVPSSNDKISFLKERTILNKKSRENMYKRYISTTLESKKCIDNSLKKGVNYVNYEVSFIIDDIPPIEYLVKGNATLHRSSVILDFRNYSKTNTVDVYYMETSVKERSYAWVKFEEIVMEAIKQDIEVNLGYKTNIISFEMDSCPRINIQGDTGNCAIWSLFLFYAYVLYPNRKALFEQLRSMSNTDRDLLLVIFIFSLFRIYPVLESLGQKHPVTSEAAKHFKKLIKTL